MKKCKNVRTTRIGDHALRPSEGCRGHRDVGFVTLFLLMVPRFLLGPLWHLVKTLELPDVAEVLLDRVNAAESNFVIRATAVRLVRILADQPLGPAKGDDLIRGERTRAFDSRLSGGWRSSTYLVERWSHVRDVCRQVLPVSGTRWVVAIEPTGPVLVHRAVAVRKCLAGAAKPDLIVLTVSDVLVVFTHETSAPIASNDVEVYVLVSFEYGGSLHSALNCHGGGTRHLARPPKRGKVLPVTGPSPVITIQPSRPEPRARAQIQVSVPSNRC